MVGGEFYKATSPQEACDLLAKFGDGARLLAGGTDLMVAVNKRQFIPQTFIYIGDAGLNYVKEDAGNILIGSATPYADILGSDLVQAKAPLLHEVVSHIASPAIRSVASIGGNLGTASPAACSAVGLLALGANLTLLSKDGSRQVAIKDFFTGPGKNVLKPGEMIKEIAVPCQEPGAGWAHRKLGKRKAQTLAVVSAAIYCPMSDGKCDRATIALGAVAPTPLLAVEAAAHLQGKKLDSELIDTVAQMAMDATNPIDDQRSSAWYRRQAAAALVKQLLREISGE